MPSVLCLNDQGGDLMDCSADVAGTLRAEEHSHQPLVLATQQGGAELGVGICPTITAAAGMSGNQQPVLFENHGVDGRYTGPRPVAPTLSARAGTGGNNLPLVGRYGADASGESGAPVPASAEGTRRQEDVPAGTEGPPRLIRRLTPLECERLQGFPDGWTDVPGASDSARYKALGNSVAVPCVEYLFHQIVLSLSPEFGL